MAYRRRRQRSFAGNCDRQSPNNNVDQLTSKYMEMCKVDSSSDSDSEISPMWSDCSTMGYASSAPESGTSRPTSSLTHNPAARHGGYSSFLDPYDGSSEESDVGVDDSRRQKRQQGLGVGGGGGCQLPGCSQCLVFPHPASVTHREVMKDSMRDLVTEQQHLLDVQMKCESDSDHGVHELDVLPSENNKENLTGIRTTDLKTDTEIMEAGLQLDAADMHGLRSSVPHSPRSQAPGTDSLFQMNRSSESSCDPRALCKRKVCLPGSDVLEQRKKRCVFTMKEEQMGQDSA